jgi:heme/copper-type cytochrome/quinol oxidase subunit 4
METKSAKIIVSIGLSIGLTWAAFWAFNASQSIPGPLYLLSVLFRYLFFIVGLLAFILRLSGFMQRKNFIYIFAAIANIWLGLVLLYILIFSQPNSVGGWDYIPNLLGGTVFLIDICRSGFKNE